MNYQAAVKYLCALLTLSLLAACGGGGGGGSGGSVANAVSGKVMDGYITGATVCLSIRGSGTCDSSFPTAVTGASGVYSFDVPAGTILANFDVLAQIPASAIDSDTGSAVGAAFTMLAPADQPLVVTPLTTLVSQYVAANPSLSATDAASQVVAGLGLPAGTNLFQDYVASSVGNLHSVAQVVNAVLQNTNLTAASAVALAQTPAETAASGGSVNLANVALAAQLNTIRQYSGAGLVAENTALDTAASNHANYLVVNNLTANASYLSQAVSGVSPSILGGHYEAPNTTDATGIDPATRAYNAGYAGSASSVGELLSIGASSATSCGASIENSVYHLIELISPFTDIGLSYNAGNGGGAVCDIELGVAASGSQLPSAGNYVFYPGTAQSGVPPAFDNQAEAPVPAPDITSLAGHPIVFSLYNQTNTTLSPANIVLQHFTLTYTDPSTGSQDPVSARVLTQSGVNTAGVTSPTTPATDGNIPAPGMLVLLPTSPLLPNTTYTVTFAATINTTTPATTVNQTWSFTTGSTNLTANAN
jgi:hypothetical protein